ncbi:hypothetical protein N0V95_008564 [Ascochyta clinopodiicola]|nr:hypothetical protein N0V95_008564 [Ascochyta clinopodiicola]
MARSLPQCVDTVIIGNGPSALILSYILHGHIPYYIGGHYDSILDAKLSKEQSLLHLTPDLYAHFLSSLRYSTQALPVNTLLDTLVRPNADTEINPKSCVEWRYEPDKAISHVAVGDTQQVGGQWADNPVSASADIGTLSYAEQLSLPGYSYADHLGRVDKEDECDFVRPSRTEFADYLRSYPEAVGISDSIYTGTKVDQVYRTADGFVIGSLGIRCKHLVLASGIFTVNIPPPPLLAPIAELDSREAPLLVVGSGFSAADIIISAPPTRRIIHIFQWAPDKRASPLRGCHHSAYPEYATVYRQMKLAAIASSKSRTARAALPRRKSTNNPFYSQRDWTLYEGFPNAEITDVSMSSSTGTATVTMRLATGEFSTYEVGGLEYVVGRRGTLDFLSSTLQAEILSLTNIEDATSTQVSGRTLRAKAETSLEVANNVLITGSLTGDSLIRHAVGGCVFAAGRCLDRMPDSPDASFRDFVPRSLAQTSPYPPPAYSHYDAPEGNAYARGGHATPDQAFPQDAHLIFAPYNPQLPQQVALDQFPSYHSFDPAAQLTWDWTQSLAFTDLNAQHEPQGELVQETADRQNPATDYSSAQPANPRPDASPAMKRKSDSELSTAQQFTNAHQNPAKRRAVSQTSSTASQSSPIPTASIDAQPSPAIPLNVTQTAVDLAAQTKTSSNGGAQERKGASKGTGPQGREIDVSEPRRVAESAGGSDMLPAGRVFPIQIGSAMFRLSGASLCSDAPSYFSHFFSEQLHSNHGRSNDVRTLYIDRDPETFRDIALHLQGYHIVPRDGEHFVKLFADAQFYSLPRLTKQLFKSDIFVSIGGTPFRIPRSTFSAPGDSPNYFSLGFAQWFSTPSEVFPGLDRAALLRPPSISPPSVPNKSGATFSELLKMLQGYEVEIRGEVHRSQLLKDARYFHLKGLEQRLVPHEISYNLKRQQSEMLIRLEDIRQSGVSFILDTPSTDTDTSPQAGTVSYARPYTDDATSNHVLILETSSTESTTLVLPQASSTTPPTFHAHASFHGATQRRITSLFSVIASKMGLPSTQPLGLMHTTTGTGVAGQPITPATSGISASSVRVRIDEDCALVVDGEDVECACDASGNVGFKRGETWIWGRDAGKNSEAVEWIIRRAQWRVRVEPSDTCSQDGSEPALNVVLCGVKIDAVTQQRARNTARGFLGGV